MMKWNIRPATVDDAPAIAALHVQGWRDAYGGLVDQAFLEAMDVAERTARWREWLADEQFTLRLAVDAAGAPAGFVSFGKLRTPIPGQSPIRPLYSGEIYALYIPAAYWRQGLGRHLMGAAAQGLAAMKHRSLCLWVLTGNSRAIGFYQALGGQRCGTKEIEISGGRHKEICFGWRDSKSLMSESRVQNSSDP